MAHSYCDLLVHVIFSTKNHDPSIEGSVAPQLFGHMAQRVGEAGGFAHIVNGTRDHVHLLVSLPRGLSVAALVKQVKGASSRWMGSRVRGFEWQVGYAAFSVSRSSFERVRAYIANQQQHHRRVSFREEWAAFLRKHGVEHDPSIVGVGGLKP